MSGPIVRKYGFPNFETDLRQAGACSTASRTRRPPGRAAEAESASPTPDRADEARPARDEAKKAVKVGRTRAQSARSATRTSRSFWMTRVFSLLTVLGATPHCDGDLGGGLAHEGRRGSAPPRGG